MAKDAPRAGSAEAKNSAMATEEDAYRCTPCRQRRGKALRQRDGRQRQDAPRAGSAEAKVHLPGDDPQPEGCTPCRQRRGKA